ncbi:hypothetical protein KIPB_002761 [Kipferlia bialata]|uniref:Uncharacterized protein n=1 Tax=Kipferlia bialata TaxID=797122 RepID=A0A391NJM6_9EUKA|nr:hypothetical protein KIPB_002761 [Kipferlia bialata]|eukprot:g2761.t1
MLVFSTAKKWRVEGRHFGGTVGRKYGHNHVVFGDYIVSPGLWGQAGALDIISGDCVKWKRTDMEVIHPVSLPLSVGQAYVGQVPQHSLAKWYAKLYGLGVIEADQRWVYPDESLEWARTK